MLLVIPLKAKQAFMQHVVLENGGTQKDDKREQHLIEDPENTSVHKQIEEILDVQWEKERRTSSLN